MKKVFFFICSLAALLAVSCSKETSVSDQPVGETIQATFNVGVETPATKAISDGTKATCLNVAVYATYGDKENQFLPDVSLVGDKAVAMRNLSANVNFTVVKGVTYNFVFWADDGTSYTKDFANGKITVNYGDSNDENKDAFFFSSVYEDVSEAINDQITLYRPLAQVNVLTKSSDLEAFEAMGGVFTDSEVTITNLPYEFDVLTCQPTDKTKDVTFSAAAMAKDNPAQPFAKIDGEDLVFVAMNYVLPFGEGTTQNRHDVTFSVNDGKFTFPSISNVPIKPNHRTNIIGNVFTTEANFVVTIDNKFDEPDLGADYKEAPTVSFKFGDVPVTVDDILYVEIRQGKKLVVETNSDGQVTISPFGQGTGSIEVGADGTITGVEQGEIYLNVEIAETDGYTKYEDQFLVVVTAPKQDPAPTFTFGDEAVTMESTLNVEVGQSKQLVVTTESDGAVTIAPFGQGTGSVEISADGTITGVEEGEIYLQIEIEETDNYSKFEDQVLVVIAPATTTGDTNGSGTLQDPFTIAGVKAYIDANNKTESTEDVYVKGVISSIDQNYTASGTYGNATFYITDTGLDDESRFEAFRLLYFNGEKFVKGQQDIAIGDEVVIVGKVTYYASNDIYETSGNKAWLYSLNGITQTLAVPTLTTSYDATAKTITASWDPVANATSYTATIEGVAVEIVNNSATASYTTTGSKEVVVSAAAEGFAPVVATATVVIPDDDPTGGNTTVDPYASNVQWTLGSSAYSDKATVNDVADVDVLKLGTSSKNGTATITIPAGTDKVTFYGVSWKALPAQCVIKNGDTEYFSGSFAANEGASGSSPYTMTVANSDKYSIEFEATLTEALELTISTTGTPPRVIIFGIKAE